ncbi:hypothetical protein M885DRAFT_549705 [Pelagophyceae sp. CCMP2097]|nr:hypothetical protein M885DRAFT_549705 [Pelagophyceae sp. CCMP2097]
MADAERAADFVALERESADLRGALGAAIPGCNAGNFHWLYAVDYAKARVAAGVAVPAAVAELEGPAAAVLARRYFLRARHAPLAALTALPLVREMRAFVRAFASDGGTQPSGARLSLKAAHDATILALYHALGGADGYLPPFTASFEVRLSDADGVRLFLDGADVTAALAAGPAAPVAALLDVGAFDARLSRLVDAGAVPL